MEGSILDRVEILELQLKRLEAQHKATVIAVRMIVAELAQADRTLLLGALHALTSDSGEALTELSKVQDIINGAEKMAQAHRDWIMPHAD